MRRFNRSLFISRKQIMIIALFLCLITTFVSILYINHSIKPILLNIAETRNSQYANMAMGIAVNEHLELDLKLDELIEFHYDQEGRVVSYQVNTALENRIQRNIQYQVEDFLALLEKGQLPPTHTDLDEAVMIDDVKAQTDLIEIPLGQVLGIPLLANLGPKIPVNLEVIGYVNTEVETLVTGMKINSVHIEPVVHISVEVRTIIPFGSKESRVEQSIPIGSGGYSGDVPLYYNAHPNDDIPYSFPLQPLQ
ncbi:sporulation protein YunB [Pelagirhabdus alkalitolerans]|uniref:Sporulation protein YunB n=1 Tax=Pelagirhabdus alkalitolerans TaxID=1612202 RepID=A0A1G6LRC4_9BACI|nr:sporulation protein YunB [Pelagirhabdus alkalitolerans]SDC45793.1 sporulation protein YunB [Pelagirhabdus alkalitolerans]